MRKVFIFDTSVLCCWLQVPGKATCGPLRDQWDHQRIEALVNSNSQNGSTFVLPIATIIETGNHIAQATGNIHAVAQSLASKMQMSADAQTPWAAFESQNDLWTPQRLHELAASWPALAVQGIGIGDATIKDVAEYYAKTGSISVEILTGDEGLKAYEPPQQISSLTPRRRR
ncbi:hypothetical protein D8T65_19225 [Vibrio vulnificus]|uniref:hypothetical protein n=1 Tax=Vibrio vulnificus TaxID=672 RepID=UPI001029E81D|nr:hypothetical protein [Vibrio vulnificus]RZP98410.1 hypothetical protein D8T65_19225 [Vibrio vulnificus]